MAAVTTPDAGLVTFWNYKRGKLIKSLALDNALLTDALNRAILPSEVDGRARFNKDLKRMFKERLDNAQR